jgi:hypothetical protein
LRADTLGDECAEDRRRQLRQPGDADPVQIGLETGQVMPVGNDRFRAQAALGGQVLEEPGTVMAKGSSRRGRPMRSKPGSTHRQHLLDCAADVRSRLLATAERCHPHRGFLAKTGLDLTIREPPKLKIFRCRLPPP